MNNINKSYYAIIPANVRYDKDLSANSKLLYGEITALCNEKGYCWASNSYFANLYNVKNETISRWIGQLVRKGYIESIIVYKETKEIDSRKLYIKSSLDEKINTYSQNNQYPHDKIINTPIDEKVKDNNTLFNNTINNTSNNKKKKKESSLDLIINEYTSNLDLKETLQDFLKMRKAQKKVMTDRALKTLLNKLDTLATTDEEKIERLEESICNCWLTVYPKKDFNNKNYKQESLDTKANKNYENLKKIMKEQQEHYEENVAKYMADCEEVPF